jgi:histone H3/H4
MAKRKAARKPAKKAAGGMIISKSRVKALVKKCNVGSEFYDALDNAVRGMIADAEKRAIANRRKTLRPADV